MDFRQYDNAIGRFNGIDALAEYSFDKTPYRFGFNNPIYWSDPSGLSESNTNFADYYDKNGVVYFDPNVGPDNLPSGATYIGPTYYNPETGTFWDENMNPTQMDGGELDGVTVSASRNSSSSSPWFYNHEGFGLWGSNRYGDLGGHRNGTRKHSIEASQIPTGFGKARDSRGKRGFWEWLFSWKKNKVDAVSRIETIDAITKDGNTSTMEVQNTEPVNPPNKSVSTTVDYYDVEIIIEKDGSKNIRSTRKDTTYPINLNKDSLQDYFNQKYNKDYEKNAKKIGWQ